MGYFKNWLIEQEEAHLPNLDDEENLPQTFDKAHERALNEVLNQQHAQAQLLLDDEGQ